MILLFIIVGYAFIGFYIGRDLLAVHRRCRVEFRQCFGNVSASAKYICVSVKLDA